MKENLIKSICLSVVIVLISNLIVPSFASISDFDNGAFMTKAEFDSAFSDIYSRFTTLETNINSKIDSRVASSVDKCIDVKQSGYVGELLIGFTLRDNCLPLYDDTSNYLKTDYPELYAKMTNDTNLSKLLLAGSDADHFKLVDISDRYGKFGDTSNAGDTGDESLPNVWGWAGSTVQYGYQGAFKSNTDRGYLVGGGGGTSVGIKDALFNLSLGQIDASGNYIPQADSTYKDGAKVNPDHIVILPMIRFKLDKVQIENVECPYAVGDIYQTTSAIDPSSRWTGTTWERIGTGNYLRYVGEGETANQQLSAELPNVKGSINEDYWGGGSGMGGFTAGSGMVTVSNTSVDVPQPNAHYGITSYRYAGLSLDKGQTKADGSYVPQSDSVYKNGGEVRPKSITAYGWIRIS